MSNTLKIITTGIILLIILSFALNSTLFSSSNDENDVQAEDQENQVDDRLAIRAHIVSSMDFSNQIFATGTIRADEEVMLRPEISGRITGIYFSEGARVEEGELLLKMNDAELQAQLKRAQYRENLAKIREERTKNLIERNAIAQEEYDIALNELNVVKAEIELIMAQIEQTEIRAPFDGVIGLKYVSTGAYVTPTTTVASFQNIDTVKIDFSIPERHASSVRSGQSFRFNRQGSNQTYQGKLFAIEPRIDAATRTLALRGSAPNESRSILPGAFVEVEFNLDSIQDAIMIPSESVIPVMGGQSVYLYRNGTVESIPIEIGVRTEKQVHVTKGVAEGDTLVTTGMLQLREGMPVRIAEISR